MRLVSYRREDERGVGVMTDESAFVALPGVVPDLPRSLRAILEMGNAALGAIASAVKGRKADLRIEDVRLDPVIPDPHAVWALALNFKAHLEETGLTTSREFPQIFLRVGASQVGHGEPLLCPHPSIARAFDYEAELAVVIGKPGRYIAVQQALDHVAGYSCYNDGSVREFQGHNRQFGLGKNFEQSGSFGPWLMTPEEFGDVRNHRVIARLNGVEKQNAPLSDMLFSVAQVIHYLSLGYRLRAGDVIAMGTPGSLKPPEGYVPGPNDSARTPGRVHMRPGDECEVEITGLGVLRNPIAADTTPLPAA